MSVQEQLALKYGTPQKLDYSSVDAYKSSMQSAVKEAAGASPYREQYKKFEEQYDLFNSEFQNFLISVENDTSEENQFNASEYFEERKKQAESLKQKAADISLYLDEYSSFYAPEYYDALKNTLSTFDTRVDDVLSLYQPSLDSKAGMAAYEDEFRAVLEQNEQLRQNQQAATFGVDPMYQSLGVFDSLFQQSTDNSKQAVTDNWTAEQRYRLGQMQMEDPTKARQYAVAVNTGQDPYVLYAQAQKEKETLLAVDLEAEEREIDRLKAELEAHNQTDFDFTSSASRKAFDQESKRLEQEIADRERQYNLAKREQDNAKFAAATENENFAANSGYSSGVDTSIFDQPYGFEDLGKDVLTYEYINNPDDVRSKINQEDPSFSAKGYDLLEPEEVGIYNYYYATEGPEKAQQYLDNIQETLNYRMGERIAQSKSGNLWKQYLSAAITGYGGAVAGLQNLLNQDADYIPNTAFQHASGLIREDLANVGKLPEFYGDASLSQIGYDLISTTANMVPSIAVGSLFGGVAGAAAMGGSAAGNAYQEALKSGYSKEQARTYAALSGASEAGLEYVLGGISKLGGEIPQRVLSNMVRGVDNAVAKAAITLGGSMASEGFEEGLQEVITPWIENLTLYTDKDVNWDDVAYSTLLGALSGGLMEGPGIAINASNVSAVDKQLKSLGAKGNTTELAELIVKHRSGEELSQEELIKLATNDKAMQVLNGVRSEDSGNETKRESAEEPPITTPSVSKEGKAIQISTNEAIETMDFASVNKGRATIQLKNGDTAEYSDVSFATEAEANQFYAAASLPGIDTENANNLLRTIQEADAGKDTDSVVGIREAYGIGYFGMQESDLESRDAAKLSPELRKAVFDIGRQQRASDAMVKSTAKPVTAKPSAGYKKVVFEGKTRQITKKQTAEIEFVDYIAENFSGNTVHVFESYKGRDGKYYYRDNNGKVHRAPNGKYVNGEIWLDLKSGDNQEGLMLNTFSHEMYHHIEKFDKAKAQELAEFVVKELGKKSVDDAVAEQIKKARKAGLGESYFERQGMTKEQARNEVYMRAMSDFVADSLETMFTRGDPAKAIANLKKENRTLFDEIKAFIDKWVSKVKEFYKDKTISKEGEMVAQLEKFEQLQQLFMEAMQGAGENYRNTQTKIKNREKQAQEEKKNNNTATAPLQTNKEQKVQPLEEENKKTTVNGRKSKKQVITGAATHAVEKLYFQEVIIAPKAAFLSPDAQPKGSNIPFILYSDNTVGLDIENSKYKGSLNTIESIYGTFSGYYDFAIDGEIVSEINILKDGNYYTFDDIKRPVVKKINGGNYVLAEKGVLNFYSDLHEVKTRTVGIQETGRNYNTSQEVIAPGETEEVFNKDGDPVAMSTEDGSVMFSIRTYEEDGRIVFQNYLDKCVTSNRLTAQEAKEMRDGIEEIYNVCKEFKDKYAPFSTWSDAEVIRDTRGRPVFSVVTPNGDYKMKLDFSLVCKKRRTLDAVFNEMSRRGIIDDFELGQKSVVKINEIIRKYDLETACSLCFVDAKRFRQTSMADSFVRLYNELVESLVPEERKGSINHFNFSGYETIKAVEGGIDTWENSELDFSHLDDVMKRYGKGTVEHKAAKYIKSRPEARKLLLRGDFMSSQGFDAVKTQNQDILKLYNSKKGTGGPKAAFGDVQYLNEIIRKERTWTPAKAYEVGGVRIQSFSDYIPRMVFDYTQMIYDLAARKLPAHAYTKESLFVKQFGLTGVKINMSLIPAVAKGGIAPGLDAKGNYVWAGESFNYDEAVEIQNAEGYSENCGTICVGVSDAHIRKLLRDPNIRMVIPYHKSGLNPIVAHMNKIGEFKNYTDDQRTKGKDGKAISKDFNFNEALKRSGDPKAAADEYLKWCADNGYTPKFNDFAKEENYYKLLEDFALYDKDGKYVPQREVRAVFPKEGNAFGTMKDLIKSGLKEDAIVEGKRDDRLPAIVDEIQRTLPRTEAEISEDQVKQADRDLEAYSLRNEKSRKKESGKSYKTEQKDLIQKMQTEQRLIREELTGKKSDISIMEKEFIRLANKYEQLDTRTGKRSIKDAKTIAQLKADLKAEAKSHREDSKSWEREFNRLLRDYETSGRQIARLEATIARQRASAKARVEGRRKTEMRHKIQRKVNELDQLLRHGTKHRNVPEFLQDSVAAVLQAINMEVRDGEQRRKTYEANLARYDRQIAAATDPATVSRLIEKRNEYAAKGDQFANRMDTLKKAYAQIREENTGLELDEGIAEHLNSLFETVGNTPLGQMTAEQLDAVNDILNVTMATVRNANEMLAEARTAGIVETSKSAIMEIKSAGETKKKKTPLRKKLEQFGWNNLKPVYAFDVIGSKTLRDRYEALRRGEDTRAVDLNEAKEFFQEQWKKNGGKDWDMDKKWKFTSTSGKSFELDLNQIMTLYAMAKDQDARSHLRVGGFAFDSDYQTKEYINLGPVKIPVKVESTDASAYNLSDEILGEIISKLTPQQRAFADAMQAYLSDTMAAKGNEVSLKKYGIRLFKKKDYFPIRVADQFMAKAREQQTGDRKLKDSGFTKERKPEAKNPVVISGFMKTWAEHVDEMSLYHSFVLPLDDFNRVLNYHDAFVEGEQAASVVEAITNAFGKGAVNYIDQLIKDVNGGIKGGSTVSFANSLMSKAKKAQTMASLSVAIQQPSSIIRAMSEVDSKYFIGPKVTEKTHDRTWSEIKKHAPVAIIKEMGGYDTNVGKSTVDYLTDTAEYNGFREKFKALFTDEKFRDDALGRLPALMDEMSWGVIWNAVKREQADKHPNMDVKSDAFMKLVANRFTEVITRTQVYDSVFSRSGLMRDRKSDLAKMVTSFMADPTTAANMLAVSILQASRGDIKGKQVSKTVGSNVASLALNAALVSTVYAMRDDDEDKRYDEKWIENFYSNFFESLNPVGYIPYVRDIYNLFVKGYDVERADMELFGDLQNAIDGLDNDDLSAWDKTENVIGAMGNLLGIPLKNIIRDGKGVFKTIAIAMDAESKDPKTKTGRYMARRGLDLNDGEEALLAIQRGDTEHIQRVFGRYESQEEAERVLQSAIREKYKNGDLTREEAEELLTTNFDREDEYEVYWLLEEMDYAKEHGSSDGYTKYGALYEAVESSGDYEGEIARLMEHGAEASTIRSQITRKYHNQYLEGDEATHKEIRDKLLLVLEATGMDESDIEDKFSSWDFEAEYGMTYSEFKAEYREGNVTEAEMRDAMKFNGMLNYEIEEGIMALNDDINFENRYGMSLSEMKDSYDDGNVTKNQLIDALVFTGKTRSEATSEVTQRDISNRYGIDYMKLDDAYKYGDISRQTLYNSMIENGATKQEADDAILGYDWLKKNVKEYPDLTISVAKKFAVRISADQPDYTLTDFGVKVDDYIKYSKLRPDCKGVDRNGDGQADSGTKRDAIFRMIDSLPISSSAKDGLALIDYGMKSIRKNAPWH